MKGMYQMAALGCCAVERLGSGAELPTQSVGQPRL